MKLIEVDIEGLPYEFTENEATELYTALYNGLQSAGADMGKLKKEAMKRGRKSKKHSGDVAFFGNWPVQTDC